MKINFKPTKQDQTSVLYAYYVVSRKGYRTIVDECSIGINRDYAHAFLLCSNQNKSALFPFQAAEQRTNKNIAQFVNIIKITAIYNPSTRSHGTEWVGGLEGPGSTMSKLRAVDILVPSKIHRATMWRAQLQRSFRAGRNNMPLGFTSTAKLIVANSRGVE